jgi:ABC-type transport system involved in multi-copper enzyme maturation permease subunit
VSSLALSTARVTTRGVIRGEWIKLRSVRSTIVTLVGAAAATLLLAVVFPVSAGQAGVGPPGSDLTDPVALSLASINITQLIVGIVGVLVIAGEYSTGLIRTTFAAVGSRLRVLGAKAVVVGSCVAALMVGVTTLAVVVGQSVYAGDQATVPFDDPGLWRAVIGATVYLAGVALLGVALGALLRSTSGAIGILVGALFVGPTLLGLLPEGVSDSVLKFLPSEAGESMMAISPADGQLGVGAAFVVFALWVVALLAAAAIDLRRRDA